MKTVVIQELAQKRVDKEIAKLDKLWDDYNKMSLEWRARHEAKNWFSKLYGDIEQALLEYRVWVLDTKLSCPERWRDRAKGLVAMCARADGELVAISPEDASFLGLYSERSDNS